MGVGGTSGEVYGTNRPGSGTSGTTSGSAIGNLINIAIDSLDIQYTHYTHYTHCTELQLQRLLNVPIVVQFLLDSVTVTVTGTCMDTDFDLVLGVLRERVQGLLCWSAGRCVDVCVYV